MTGPSIMKPTATCSWGPQEVVPPTSTKGLARTGNDDADSDSSGSGSLISVNRQPKQSRKKHRSEIGGIKMPPSGKDEGGNSKQPQTPALPPIPNTFNLKIQPISPGVEPSGPHHGKDTILHSQLQQQQQHHHPQQLLKQPFPPLHNSHHTSSSSSGPRAAPEAPSSSRDSASLQIKTSPASFQPMPRPPQLQWPSPSSFNSRCRASNKHKVNSSSNCSNRLQVMWPL